MKVILRVQQNGGEYHGITTITTKNVVTVQAINGNTVQLGDTVIEFDEYIEIKEVII